ncbi:MAG: hypothetical protein JRN20_05685 [Nitrososphaerota archaeon]|nr:hypothetical protein [Nitrososphaerota archaeon]
MFRVIIEAAVGALMIVMGLLFLIYIPNSPTNLASDFIFLGGGALITKRAYEMNKKRKIEALAQTRNSKKQKQSQKKRSPRE